MSSKLQEIWYRITTPASMDKNSEDYPKMRLFLILLILFIFLSTLAVVFASLTTDDVQVLLLTGGGTVLTLLISFALAHSKYWQWSLMLTTGSILVACLSTIMFWGDIEYIQITYTYLSLPILLSAIFLTRKITLFIYFLISVILFIIGVSSNDHQFSFILNYWGFYTVITILILIVLHVRERDQRHIQAITRQSIENEARLQSIIDNASASIFIKDLSGTYTLMNKIGAQIFNLTPQDLIGKTDDELFGPEAADIIHKIDKSVIKSQKPIVYERTQRVNNKSITFLTTQFPYTNTLGEVIGLGGISYDISTRKQAEDNMRYQATLLKNVSDAIIGTTTDFHILSWNHAAEKLYGWEAKDVMGKNFFTLIKTSFPNGALPEVVKLLAHQESWEGEVTQWNGYDQRIYVQSSMKYLKNSNGERVGFIIVNRDISLEKLVAQEKERLIHDLDAFSRSVAHDLKNPLNNLLGLIDFLQNITSFPEDSEEAGILRNIDKTGYHMVHIVDELLNFAMLRSIDDITMHKVKMHQLLQDVQTHLKFMIEESKAQITIIGELPDTLGYKPWIGQVWENYLSNAIKYGGNPPQIEIEAKLLRDKLFVEYWIRDNGAGIPPESQDKIFMEFGRVEHRKPGYGLGLSIVKRIVEKLGGEVGFESELGKGSRFWFRLPFTPAMVFEVQNAKNDKETHP